MRLFPTGSSNLFKTGVLWGVIFAIGIVSALVLGLIFDDDTMEQCNRNYRGDVTVENCNDYDQLSGILMSPLAILSFPAIIYSALGFLEYKRKKTLTVVMGAHAAKNYMKFERLLKLVNKNPSEELLTELQNELYMTGSPLMSYLTNEEGSVIKLERSDVLNIESLNVIFNTVAATVEPAAAVHDEAVRLQKMQIKASQQAAEAERLHQKNMINSHSSDTPVKKKGGAAGSIAKGLGTFMIGGARHTYYCRKCGSVRSGRTHQPKMCCGMNMKRQK